MTRLLVFGAGRVAGPVYEDLGRQSTVEVTAVSVFPEELENVIKLCPSAKTECVDISKDITRRDALIEQHDIVVGLIPYPMIPEVCRACLRLKKNFVSPSYVSEDISNLHEQVKEADLTFMSELGLDPGIDHMLAMKTCDDIRRKGGRATVSPPDVNILDILDSHFLHIYKLAKLTPTLTTLKVSSYELWCGGLPAPENAQDNPLKYKFSWYPKGSLMACNRGGGFMKDKKVTILQPGLSLLENVTDLNFTEEFQMEGFPNIYKESYLKLYNIESVDNFIRGTLRYKGFSAAVLPLMKLGLFGDTPLGLLADGSMQHSWREIICHEMGESCKIGDHEFEKKVLNKLGSQSELDVCRRLGLLSDDVIETKGTILDTLAFYLESKQEFMFGKMKRDLVLMRIKVEGKYPDGSQESRHLDLTVYGDPGRHSAMAKTVGHTIASAVMLLVKGEITERGILLPVSENVYRPVLADLSKKGIIVTEKIS